MSKMKIVIVHYRYFVVGGPERYLFNIIDILESHGHEVIPFSVDHNRNAKSQYAEYFLDPVGSGNEVYGHEYNKFSLSTISKVMGRMIYSFEAKKKFKRLLNDVKPDLVYVLQFQNKISASVIDAAWELKIPVVQRISDFAHICIDNIFYHYQSQKVCELCLHGSKLNGIKNKCANNSYINSTIKVVSLAVQDIRRTKDKISSFIIPAEFTVKKFIEFGVDKRKIFHIPTFFNNKAGESEQIDYGNFFLYVGRVDPDKGLLTLVKAFVDSPYKLVIVGTSTEGYDQFLKDFLVEKKHQITFTGKLDFQGVSDYIKSCLCTIVPSEWYDNLPNSVLESYAYKKCVIASNIGSLKDLIIENETGLHFETGNVVNLRKIVKYLFDNREEASRMGNNAYKLLAKEYNSNLHYSRLIRVFEETVNNY